MTSKTRQSHLSTKRTPLQRKNPQRNTESPNAIFTKNTFRAFLITLAIGGGLILVASLGAYFHPDPDSIIHPLAYVVAVLTAFFGGFTAGKLRGNAPAICGLVNGILLTCVMILLSFCFLSESSGYSALVSTLLHTAVPVLSVLGAMVGTRKKQKTYTRKKY